MFLVQLKLRRRRGLRQVVLGLVLLSLIIPAWLVVRGIDGAMVLTVLSGSVATIGGIAITGRGLLQVGRATRHQLAVNELRQLPAARVLKP